MSYAFCFVIPFAVQLRLIIPLNSFTVPVSKFLYMQKSRKKGRHILASDFHITHQDNTKIWKEKQENRGRKKKLNTKKSRYDQDQQELQRQRWHKNENWLQTNIAFCFVIPFAVQLRLIIPLNSFNVPVMSWWVMWQSLTEHWSVYISSHDVSSADAESIQSFWVWVAHVCL
jgi:hypothetical protein